MADYDRYSNSDREDHEGREAQNWRRGRNRGQDHEARLDDRTGYGPGSPGGYRADRYYQGNARDYGRDDDRSSTYGGYEDRSFINESSPYHTGSTDPYGYDRAPYRPSESAREYQTNRNPGMKGNYDSEGFGGRYRSPGRPDTGRESYDFQPYGTYGGIGPDFGFGHDRQDRSAERDRNREPHRNFFDRAVDAMQSWFNPDDRRGAHAGRGPKGYKRSDERVREDVSDRLADDSWLDASDIEVTVSEMEVTLAGTVPDRDAKRRAEHLAENISGVKHVQNNLRVSEFNKATPGTSTVIESDSVGVASSTLNKQAAGRA